MLQNEKAGMTGVNTEAQYECGVYGLQRSFIFRESKVYPLVLVTELLPGDMLDSKKCSSIPCMWNFWAVLMDV